MEMNFPILVLAVTKKGNSSPYFLLHFFTISQTAVILCWTCSSTNILVGDVNGIWSYGMFYHEISIPEALQYENIWKWPKFLNMCRFWVSLIGPCLRAFQWW